MWKIKLYIFTLIAIFILITGSGVRADQLDDLQKQINDLQGKIAASQNQEKTLASQIDLINNQISLTKLKITDTQAKLNRLVEDIDSVSGKINRLEESLAQVSNVLANRIVETYIAGRSDPIVYILSSNDFNDLIQRLEYLRIAQKHDKSLMFQMAASKKNYHDQKDLLEDKKKQVQLLSEELKNYQAELDKQGREKQNLLIATRNDETRYQQLLAQAQAQLAAFRGFVAGQGGASLLSNQTFCNDWGCYYNQRDTSWGLLRIGLSNDSLAEYGCLVTSSAMVLSHYGHRVTPAQVAQTLDAFFPPTALMLLSPWSVDGATFVRQSVGGGTGTIDSELAAGHPVIVGIGAGPAHFVVIKSKDGDKYIMNDPYVENGHDIPFTSKYSLSSISAVNSVRVN